MTHSNKHRAGNWALITGASAGLGVDFAHIHASRGGNVVLVARRLESLERLKSELQKKYPECEALVYSCDLSLEEKRKELIEYLNESSIEINVLINNAGFGQRGEFNRLDRGVQTQMVDLNVQAVLDLTHRVVSSWVEKGLPGKVLNLGSVAGFMPGPGCAVYYATKAFIVSWSQAMSHENRKHSIFVSVLCPGPTRTEFAKVASMNGTSLFDTMSADSYGVALKGYEGMMSNKMICIPGLLNKISTLILPRIFPRSWVAKISYAVLKRTA